MVTRGDGSSLEAREMNGLHAPPTGDHEGPHNPTRPRSPLRIIQPRACLHGLVYWGPNPAFPECVAPRPGKGLRHCTLEV